VRGRPLCKYQLENNTKTASFTRTTVGHGKSPINSGAALSQGVVKA